MLKKQKVNYCLRSRDGLPDNKTEIYLADTIGEMGLWYKLCRVVLLGKSILGNGGQNPIEPALFGCAVICGENVENFSEVVEELVKVNSLIKVKDSDDVLERVNMLLSNEKEVDDMGARAKKFSASKSKAIDEFYAMVKSEFESCGISFK